MGAELFGTKLREHRKKTGLTQKDLAEKAGIKASEISAYEKEEIIPSLDMACRIAQALGISLQELVSDSASIAVATYTDILRLLKYLNRRNDVSFSVINTNGQDRVVFIFNDREISEMFRGFPKMLELLECGIITDELYRLWYEGFTRKYDRPLERTTFRAVGPYDLSYEELYIPHFGRPFDMGLEDEDIPF